MRVPVKEQRGSFIIVVVLVANIIHIGLLLYWFLTAAIKLPDLTPLIAIANGGGLIVGLIVGYRWNLLFDQVISFTARASGAISASQLLSVDVEKSSTGRVGKTTSVGDDDDETKRQMMRRNWFIVCLSVSAYGSSSRASLWHRLSMDSWEIVSFYLQDLCVVVLYYFLFDRQLGLLPNNHSFHHKRPWWSVLSLASRLIIMRLPFMMFQVFGMLGGEEITLAFMGTLLFTAFLTMLILSSVRLLSTMKAHNY